MILLKIDVSETETIIKCNYKILEEKIDENKQNENNNQFKINQPEDLKKKYVEFIMQNKIYLLAKDLDLYCNIIEFVPKFILYNKLKYRLILTCNKSKEMIILQAEQKKPFYFCALQLTANQQVVERHFGRHKTQWRMMCM